MAKRTDLPAGTLTLYALARTGGDAAGDLCGLASARGGWRAARRIAFRGAGGGIHRCAGFAICVVWAVALGADGLSGHQSRRHYRGIPSPSEGFFEGVAWAYWLGAGLWVVHRHFCSGLAISANHSAGRCHRDADRKPRCGD